MCTSEDMTTDRQTHKDKDTDSKTYMVITILCSPIGHGVISRHTAVDWILQTRSNSGILSSFINTTKLHLCQDLLVKVNEVHTHPFNGPFSRTTQVSRYQKGKTNLDFTGARDSEWQWHQPSHMQVCTSLETDNHASTPPLKFFTGRMPFLPPNQQHQSTEGDKWSTSASN